MKDRDLNEAEREPENLKTWRRGTSYARGDHSELRMLVSGKKMVVVAIVSRSERILVGGAEQYPIGRYTRPLLL